MVKAKIKEDVYHIPTKWSELTYQQYMDIEKAVDEDHMVASITGIPVDIILNLEDDQLQKVLLAIQFVRIKFKPDDFEIPDKLKASEKEIPYVSDICEKTFGQKIYFHHCLKVNVNSLESAIPELVAIYSQPYVDDNEFDINRIEHTKELIKDVFFVDLYATAIGYIKQLKQILENEASALTVKPDANQVEAGVGMFDQFGIMNTVKALANNDVTKYAEIEKLEYNTVFIHMRMNKVQNDFNENYRKILERNSKTK